MFACSSVNIAREIHYTCIIKWSTALTVPAHICWHPEQWTVIKLTRTIQSCGEEAPLRRNVPWRSIVAVEDRSSNCSRNNPHRWKRSWLIRHPTLDTTLNLAFFIGILNPYRPTSGMENFKPAPTPSSTVQRIIRHLLSWFNNTTSANALAVCMGHHFKKRGIHFWEIKKQKHFTTWTMKSTTL